MSAMPENEANTQPFQQEVKISLSERAVAIFLKLSHGVEYYDGNVRETREAVWRFLDRAYYSIKIVAGELTEGFYAKPQTIDALTRASQRGVKIQIIAGPELRDRSFKGLTEIRDLEIRQMDPRPSPHFKVIDGKHLKIEAPHPPDAPNRRFYIAFNVPKVASEFEDEFDKMWEAASAVNRHPHEQRKALEELGHKR